MEKQWEYTIPYGMEATIVDNKIIFKKKESEDERIRKEIINFIKVSKPNWENYRDYSSWITWLEKKGEQKPTDEEIIEILRTEYEKGRADAITEMRKPWSEEDTIALNRIIAILVDASEVKCWWEVYRLIEKEEMIRLTDFLNSLINRVQSPPKQEWSEEDGKMVECCKIALEFFENLGKNSQGFPHENYFDLDERIYPSEVNHWLKSLEKRAQHRTKQ